MSGSRDTQIGAADRSKSGKFTWHDGKEIPF